MLYEVITYEFRLIGIKETSAAADQLVPLVAGQAAQPVVGFHNDPVFHHADSGRRLTKNGPKREIPGLLGTPGPPQMHHLSTGYEIGDQCYRRNSDQNFVPLSGSRFIVILENKGKGLVGKTDQNEGHGNKAEDYFYGTPDSSMSYNFV